MADTEPADGLPVTQPASPCRHLRNKGMYVYTDGQDDYGQGDYDNSLFWCMKTMKGYGPDEELVDGYECRNPTRSCYEET